MNIREKLSCFPQEKEEVVLEICPERSVLHKGPSARKLSPEPCLLGNKQSLTFLKAMAPHSSTLAWKIP